jgi:hypothetical protein
MRNASVSVLKYSQPPCHPLREGMTPKSDLNMDCRFWEKISGEKCDYVLAFCGRERKVAADQKTRTIFAEPKAISRLSPWGKFLQIPFATEAISLQSITAPFRRRGNKFAC